MKGMHRIALFAIVGTMAFAQSPSPAAEQPPAGLEEAVKARANEFYALLVKQQYRKAEAYIAEDTKDYYYGGSKPEVKKYDIEKVDFSEQFTHAKVFTRCIEPVVVAGFPPGNMNVVVPTLWRLEDGNWFLYEDPNKIRNPSGLASKIQSATADPQSSFPAMPKELPKDAGYVFGKIFLDKTEVRLTPGGTATIKIANGAEGPMQLQYGYPLGDIQAKLDHTELLAGQKAVLTLTAGKQPVGGYYYLRVVPTGEAIKIRVLVQ